MVLDLRLKINNKGCRETALVAYIPLPSVHSTRLTVKRESPGTADTSIPLRLADESIEAASSTPGEAMAAVA